MSRIMDRNGVLKIVSVIIAFILWLYAVSELNPEVTRPLSDIEIEIENEEILINKGFTLVKDPPSRTNIRVRGLGNDVSKVKADNIKAIIDLSKIEKEGTQRLALRIDGLTPREVRLDSVPEVSIEVNRIRRKTIPVEIELYGQRPKDYYVHDPIINPQSITIVGAESLVDQVVKGAAEVNIEDVEDTLNLSLPITLYGDDNKKIGSKYIELLQEYVLVSIPVYNLKTRVPVTPTLIGESAEGYVVDSITVSPSDFSINGERDLINNVSKLITEEIDITGRNKDLNISVALEEIQGIYIDKRFTNDVKVNVRVNLIEETIQRSFEIDEIELLNIPTGYTAQVLDEKITIVAKGKYSTMNMLTADAFTAALNLEGLTEGEHELSPQLVTPTNVTKEGTEPVKIRVILTPITPSTNENEGAQDQTAGPNNP